MYPTTVNRTGDGGAKEPPLHREWDHDEAHCTYNFYWTVMFTVFSLISGNRLRRGFIMRLEGSRRSDKIPPILASGGENRINAPLFSSLVRTAQGRPIKIHWLFRPATGNCYTDNEKQCMGGEKFCRINDFLCNFYEKICKCWKIGCKINKTGANSTFSCAN